jgi:hypothetical protein
MDSAGVRVVPGSTSSIINKPDFVAISCPSLLIWAHHQIRARPLQMAELVFTFV